jgi:CBS domain-containing protein
MPCVHEILALKDSDQEHLVYTIPPTISVHDAVRKMNLHRIGALVVVDDGQVVGMFTERDVLRLVGALQTVTHIMVRDVMTRDVCTVTPTTDIEDAQELMRSRRIRHLPVIDPIGRLTGIVSIGDLNAWCVAHQARQIEGLHDYIHGRA